MKMRKEYKIPRNSYELQRQKEERSLRNLKAWMIILPIVMTAVLIVGVYFGYLGYTRSSTDRELESGLAETEKTDPMLLRVVNSARPLESSYAPKLSEIGSVKVASSAAGSLDRMLAKAKKDGAGLKLSEGYISYEEQKERYESAVRDYRENSEVSVVKAEAYVRGIIPKQGECEQQTGLVIRFDSDEDGDFENSGAFSWLKKNADSFGFILRYPDPENTGGVVYSPYLFRYVGEDNAYFMRAYNMNFDEYTEYMSSK